MTADRRRSGTELGSSGFDLSRRGFLKAGGVGALSLGAGASLLSACSSKSSGSSGSGGKTTLKLMSWEQFEVAEKPAWFKLISDFEAANPNIKVEWTGWPFATFDQNVISQAQAGKVDADLVMCPPELASALINNYQATVPLQSITTDLKLTPIPAHDQFKHGSDLHGLGLIDVPFALTYDQRLLKEAGFATPPTTLDEWMHQATALTHRPQQFGMDLLNSAADGADWWNQLQNFPLAYDGAWATRKTLQIDSDPVVKSMEYWLQLLNAAGPKGSSEAAIQNLYNADRIAMNLNVAAGITSFEKLAPKLYPNIRSTPPPWPSKKAIARLHPIVVIKDSKQKDAAMELVKFLVTPKNLYYVTTKNGYPIIPFSNFGDYVPQYATYLKTTPWMSGYLNTNYVGEVDLLGNYTLVYAQIGQIITKAMANAVSGGTSVRDALGAAQQQATSELSHRI